MQRIFLALLFSAISTIVLAQTAKVGLEGGLNFASQSNSGGYVGKTLVNFHAGIIVNVDFKDFALEPGLLYSGKGINYTNHLPDENGQLTIAKSEPSNIDYIEMPLNVVYKIHTSKNVSINLGGGPYVAIAVSASEVSNGQTIHYSIGNGYYNYYKTFDYGPNFVFAAEFNNSFMIKANYSTSLTDISGPFFSVGLHNHVAGLSVAYLFK